MRCLTWMKRVLRRQWGWTKRIWSPEICRMWGQEKIRAGKGTEWKRLFPRFWRRRKIQKGQAAGNRQMKHVQKDRKFGRNRKRSLPVKRKKVILPCRRQKEDMIILFMIKNISCWTAVSMRTPALLYGKRQGRSCWGKGFFSMDVLSLIMRNS